MVRAVLQVPPPPTPIRTMVKCYSISTPSHLSKPCPNYTYRFECSQVLIQLLYGSSASWLPSMDIHMVGSADIFETAVEVTHHTPTNGEFIC